MGKYSGFFKLPDEGGIFKLEKEEVCRHQYHNMPTHISIPSGHGYRHVCPGCGKVSVATNPVTFMAN